MKVKLVAELWETLGNLLALMIVITLVITYLANIVGTIRGDINTWLGVIGFFVPPVGWFYGLVYLL